MVMASIGSRFTTVVLAAIVALAFAGGVSAQVRVITTIPDFADIARRIGGDAVTTSSLTRGHEDLHLVRIRPSLLIRLRRADVFIQLGLDAEHSWVPALIRTARNERIEPGAPGFCDASVGIEPLDVPERVTRGAGPDLHPNGNPHYNLDPKRMRVAARNILACLSRVAPAERAAFESNHAAWEKELERHEKAWREQLAPLRGAAFIEAHASWTYFADTFDLRIIGQLEPSPGSSPTPSHLAELVRIGKRAEVGMVVGRAGYADVARRVADEIGAESVQMPICSATSGELEGWFAFMDHVVESFARTLTPLEPDSGGVEASARSK